jgi:hypothetical protein
VRHERQHRHGALADITARHAFLLRETAREVSREPQGVRPAHDRRRGHPTIASASAFIVDEGVRDGAARLLALEAAARRRSGRCRQDQSAKVLADVLGTDLIRLQCYEGLDAMAALYEWNYPRQMLHARLSEADGSTLEEREAYVQRAVPAQAAAARRVTRSLLQCCSSTK